MPSGPNIAKPRPPGATRTEWRHFATGLALTPDLLPVVSDTTTPISPRSHLKALGKTPSIITNGQAHGLTKWTTRTSTAADIATWDKDPHLGICIQTRRVRALDIDVDDPATAAAIAAAFEAVAVPCPTRTRPNSGKRLLAFIVEGPIPKRRVEVRGGVIELLATGQQFVACGTHPSGVRYQWQGKDGNALPADLPVLSLAELDAAWAHLVAAFATARPTQSRPARLPALDISPDIATDDAVARYLRDQKLILGQAPGKLFVACPWKARHTSDSGLSETAWLLAGTGGYKTGRFQCQHAHCHGRSNADFLRCIGFTPPGSPALIRNRQGRIDAVVNNLVTAISDPDICGLHIGWDTFRDELSKAPRGDNSPDQWQPFRDADYMEIRCTLEAYGFKPIAKETLRDVVHMLATRNPFDTAQTWLDTLTWDGTPRIDTFLARYFGCADTAYTTAVSAYLWTALAGRVITPGIKADMAPILVGEQGRGKSTGVAAMSPDHSFFREISFHDNDDDKARKLRGCLVAELAELQGLNSREEEGIKAFVTRTHENWVPKFKEFAVSFPRRCVFIGTTNKDEFLADDTGNRRWLPVRSGQVDVSAIRTDCLQLWAEAAVRFRQHGIAYQQAEALGRAEHEHYMVGDPWDDVITTWLDADDDFTGKPPRSREYLRIEDVLSAAVGLKPAQIGKREEMRATRVLIRFGYTRKKLRLNGKPARVWQSPLPLSSP